jgi:hypothetical protein
VDVRLENDDRRRRRVGRGDGGARPAGHGPPRRRQVPSCSVPLLRQARLPSVVVQGPPERLFTAGNVDRSASHFTPVYAFVLGSIAVY